MNNRFIVQVGSKFLYSDEKEGDQSFTVKHIVHGGFVYVEENDDTMVLEYVRKKVRVYTQSGPVESSSEDSDSEQNIPLTEFMKSLS